MYNFCEGVRSDTLKIVNIINTVRIFNLNTLRINAFATFSDNIFTSSFFLFKYFLDHVFLYILNFHLVQSIGIYLVDCVSLIEN